MTNAPSLSAAAGRQSWWELLAIQSGGTLCLPIVCVGQLLGLKYGWQEALCAIMVGNGLLLMAGLAMAHLSTGACRLSTFGHVEKIFGPRLQRSLGLLMIVSMLGWFALQIDLMAGALLGSNPPLVSTLAIGMMITGLMVLGCQAMRRIAVISAPLLMLGLLCLFINTNGDSQETHLPFSWEWMGGISLVFSAHIAVIVDLPTFFQHARCRRDGLVCVACLYGLVVPLVEAGGVWLATIAGQMDLVSMPIGGPMSLLIGGLFVLSGWSANNANLYSAVEASLAIGFVHARAVLTLMLGGLGTLLACMNLLGHLEPFLEFIGMTLGPMGAIMIIHYLYRGGDYVQNNG